MNFSKFFSSNFFSTNRQKSDAGLGKLEIPSHIAIIMDGNARWAKSRNLPIDLGHKFGAENIRKIVENCIEMGVKYLTLYAFSMENWDRPKDEVEYLLKLLDNYLESEIEPLIKKNIAIVIAGDLSKLSDSLRNKILKIEEATKNNDSLMLNVAFSYGSRQEIVDATKQIILALENKEITFSQIDEKLFSKNLYRSNIPDPDLLIRTAGDKRLSNFLLWQLAYTELYFVDVFWPDFDKNHLLQAITEFNKRQRRYGKR
jgi:undecaprenyl diphosphate synthase